MDLQSEPIPPPPPPKPSAKTEGPSVGGDVTLFYPDGTLAVMVTVAPTRTQTMMYSSKGVMLVSFDSFGVGSINHANGRPWLTAREHTYTVSSPTGDTLEHATWPRTSTTPLLHTPVEEMTISFTSRTAIECRFSTENIAERTFQLGQALKRTDSYLLNKTKNPHSSALLRGKVQLDVEAIRARFAREGHLYSGAPSPHSLPPKPSLRATLGQIDQTSDVVPLIHTLTSSDDRLNSINTFPTILTGTTRTTAKSIRVPPEDYGTPELSASLRRLMVRPKVAPFTPKRARLTLLSDDFYRMEVVGDERDERVLHAVCLTASWAGPTQRAKAETAAAEVAQLAHGDLGRRAPRKSGRPTEETAGGAGAKVEAEAEAKGKGKDKDEATAKGNTSAPPSGKTTPADRPNTSSSSTRGGGGGSVTSGGVLGDGAPLPSHPGFARVLEMGLKPEIRLLDADSATARTLCERHRIRHVPFFLFFARGKMVHATNNVTSTQDLFREISQAADKVRRGEFLADNFAFSGGMDNVLLDSITVH